MKTKIIILFIIWFFLVNIFFINNKNIALFNTSNNLYKQEKYDDTIKILDDLQKLKNTDLDDKILYNLWNAFYRKATKDNAWKKIEFLEKSLDYYLQSINLKYDKKTEKNIEFVKQILEKEKQKQEKQDKKDDKKEQDKQDNTQSASTNTWELSKEQIQALEKYEEKLKEEQAQIWENYNKKSTDSQDPFTVFDSFFENNIQFDIEGKEEEKDW